MPKSFFDLGNNIFPINLIKIHPFPTDFMGFGGEMTVFGLSYMIQMGKIKAVNESITYHIEHQPHSTASFYDWCKAKMVIDYALNKLRNKQIKEREFKKRQLGI